MPSKDYSFLSDRERDYLRNPDDYEGQESSNIAYRIRQKRKQVQEDFELLEESIPAWDVVEREGSDCEIVCKRCGDTEERKSAHYRHTGGDAILHGIDWIRWDVSGWPIDSVPCYCPDCWTEAREKGREMAREKARVPCFVKGHNYHKITSEPVNDCLGAGVPFGEEELEQLKEEYRERHHSTCPECGTPKTEMERSARNHFVCDCGWEGPHNQMTYSRI